MTPEQAQWLVQAGAWVILLVENAAIFAAGFKEAWVFGATLRRSLAREAVLRTENGELRKALEANTATMKEMSSDFVRGLSDQADVFERALREQTGTIAGEISSIGHELSQLSGLVIHDLRGRPADDPPLVKPPVKRPAPRSGCRRA
jgi:hypothetical protein